MAAFQYHEAGFTPRVYRLIAGCHTDSGTGLRYAWRVKPSKPLRHLTSLTKQLLSTVTNLSLTAGFLLALLLFSTALAQFAQGEVAEQVADEAVHAWLAEEPFNLSSISTMNTVEICQALPKLVKNPPPQPGTRVNFEDRRELATDDVDTRRFTYSAVRPKDRLEIVQVTLERQEDSWVATEVGYRARSSLQGRNWLQQPWVGWLFLLLSVYAAYLLTTPSFLRRWLGRGWQNIRQHRGIVLGTLIFLYSIFALGAFTGSRLPSECSDAILSVVNRAVATVGATDAYASGNVPRAAAVTFYQNFVIVTLSITYSLALLFGIPAYLLSILSYFAQAIPFGLLGAFSGPHIVLVLILLLLELTSYFLVVAGGGIFLATIIRKGLGGLSEAFIKLTLMLPIALVLLLIGAWYEAVVVAVP